MSMNKKILLVINPRSGKGAAKRVLLTVITMLSDAGGEVTVLPTKKGTETSSMVCDALLSRKDYDLVIASGGDGTLNLVVEGLLRSGLQLPLGYIPLGTTNDFAASLGIPSDPRKATKAVIDGTPTGHDVGLFNERHFTYIACCGIFTRASYATSQSLKNLFGHAAYMLGAIQTLSSVKPMNLSVTLENEVLEGEFLFCALANTKALGGVLQLDEKEVVFGDGLFELILIRKPKDIAELGLIAARLLSTNLNDPHIILRHVSACEIRSDTGIAWSLDGEGGGETELASLSVEKSAVYLLK